MTKDYLTSGQQLTIGVLGLGHVGLPTALGFASLGWSVVGADDDQDKVKCLGRGEMPFYEPGLEELLRDQLALGRFRLSSDVPEVVQEADVIFVCVGTPQHEDGSADVSQLERVAITIARHLNRYKLIVEKSTTPVRTASQLKRAIARYSDDDLDFDVAVNPEFLREGSAVFDFMNPDRIVLGVDSQRAKELLLRIYKPLIKHNGYQDSGTDGSTHSDSTEVNRHSGNSPSGSPIVLTDPNTAEIIKHASNSFLATKISFINLVSDMCEVSGADVREVASAMGMDPRISPHFLDAGVGFGGYCLPKDLRAFIFMGEERNVDMALLRAVSDVNDARVEKVISKIRQALWVLEDKTLAIWGLAFKPGTGDIREAPSIEIMGRLLAERCSLRVYDPEAMLEFKSSFSGSPERVVYCKSPEDACEGAHGVLLLTEWPQFREVDLAQVRDIMTLPVIVDGRNLLDPNEVRQLGFEYHCMGR